MESPQPESGPRGITPRPTAGPGSFLGHALAFFRRGWSIIPIRHKTAKGKEPACNWKPYQRRAPSQATLRRLFAEPNLDGLGVICGDVSDLVIRDFDDAASYEQWAAAHTELATALPTVKTARGFHVYFRCGFRGIKHEADGELRGAGYCLVPPSTHPSGHIYEWINPLPMGSYPCSIPLKTVSQPV